MKKMSNKKKKDILETALGLWTGICFGGWLCNAIECRDAEALVCAVVWIAGPAVIFFIAGLWQVRKIKQRSRQRSLLRAGQNLKSRRIKHREQGGN